jgi:hypothetical protein
MAIPDFEGAMIMKTANQYRGFLAAAFSILLLLGTSPAQAQTVVQDPAGNATGILNLEVSGEFYDVELVFGQGLELLGGPLEITWKDEGNALVAVEAIASALVAESTPVTTVGPDTSNYYDIPYVIIGSNARIVRGNADGSGGWTSGNAGESVDYGAFAADRSWAKFTPASGTPVEDKVWGQLKRLYQ